MFSSFVLRNTQTHALLYLKAWAHAVFKEKPNIWHANYILHKLKPFSTAAATSAATSFFIGSDESLCPPY